MNTNDIITGERIQSHADVYIATPVRFMENPFIFTHKQKHLDIDSIIHLISKSTIEQKPFKLVNPRVIFCYGDFLFQLQYFVDLFTNPFILISHNSDENITKEKPYLNTILNCKNLINWYAQNVCVKHEKLHLLPIGIANAKWEHGNVTPYESIFDIFKNKTKNDYLNIKTKHIFMNFNIHTNPLKRIGCFETMNIKKKIPFLKNTTHCENITRMVEYQFCICPEGNGVDSHRIWECYYLKIVPIMLKNDFTTILKETTNLPMILLNDWNEFDIEKLPTYETYIEDLLKTEHLLYLRNLPIFTPSHY